MNNISIVVDLDDCDDSHHDRKSTPKRVWIETPMYTLYSDEEAILMSSSDWLNDTIINAAQVLLKN